MHTYNNVHTTIHTVQNEQSKGNEEKNLCQFPSKMAKYFMILINNVMCTCIQLENLCRNVSVLTNKILHFMSKFISMHLVG